jgi:hypothetical protein
VVKLVSYGSMSRVSYAARAGLSKQINIRLVEPLTPNGFRYHLLQPARSTFPLRGLSVYSSDVWFGLSSIICSDMAMGQKRLHKKVAYPLITKT